MTANPSPPSPDPRPINLAQAAENRRLLARPGLIWLEKAWLLVESGLNRFIGAQQLNPFYHTGTISLYLFVLVILSGLYLTLFYRYGTEASYASVQRINAQVLGRLMRGIHRYASDAAVIFIVLHTLREFFKGHFWGNRWLAWVSGVILLGLTWVTGTTGYWLVWDQRGRLINDGVTDILSAFPSLGGPYALTFLTNERAQGLPLFFVILIFIHIFIPLVMGGLFWLHIVRLSRAKMLPPHFQMIGIGLILAGLALSLPASIAEPVDLSQLPPLVGLDYYYLSYLPTTLRFAPLVFWSISLFAFTLLILLPWIFPPKRLAPAGVTLAQCTGCTFCAHDCPYTAITMIPRTDDKPYKQEAVVDPHLCVSCGICGGSCAWDAVGLGDWPNDLVWAEIVEQLKGAADLYHHLVLVFACQRHMNHGAQRLIAKLNQARGETDDELRLISLPCVGMLVPTHISRALDIGASEVIIAGCPLEDCDAREGNVWLAEELARHRPPFLRRREHAERVRTLWLPPNERAGLRQGLLNRLKLSGVTRFHLARTLVLLALLFALTTLATDIPFQAYGPNAALLQVGLRHSTQFIQPQTLSPDELAKLPQHLQLKQIQGAGRFPLHLVIRLDGQLLLDETYQPQGVRHDGATFVLEKINIPPGTHTLLVQVDDGGEDHLRPVIAETIEVKPGQVIVVGSDPVAEFELLP